MLAGKINSPLGHFLITGELSVLTHLIGAVASEQVRVAGWIAERCEARVVAAHARPHHLELIEKLLRVASGDAGAAAGGIRSWRSVGSAFRTAGVIGQ